MTAASQLVLGIDAGGTKTTAWLVSADALDGTPLGCGTAGPANPRAVGFDVALANLDRAIEDAFADADLPVGATAAVCVAMAGVDRDVERMRLQKWADDKRIAEYVLIVNDALPVLAAGTPEGWGIAVISGTGSFAIGCDRKGRVRRKGGWGYLLGDQGSAYAVALAGLQAVAKAADGCARPTKLTDSFLERLQVSAENELITAVYQKHADRSSIAALADVVIETAMSDDLVAKGIVDNAAHELVTLAVALAVDFGWDANEFPVALSGGLLLHSDLLRESFCAKLAQNELQPSSINVVREPVAGAVLLAKECVAGV